MLAEKIAAEENLTFILNAPVCSVIKDSKDKSKIIGVEYRNIDGRMSRVRAKVVIDATGSGVLSELAGAKFMFGRDAKEDFNEEYAADKRDSKVQPCTMMAILQRFKKVENCQIAKLLKNDFFKKRFVAVSGVGWAKKIPEEIVAKTDNFMMWVGAVPCDTKNNFELAKAQQKIINNFVPQFEQELWKEGFTIHIAPKIGVRECRRILGDKIITSNDLLSDKYPDDVISWGKYRIDAWGRKLPKEIAHKPLNFGIPYGATLVKGFENLMMCGKHISGSSIAMSAYRVQPIVACMGEAVGCAAAMSVAQGVSPRNVDIKQLQKVLVKRGILPNNYA